MLITVIDIALHLRVPGVVSSYLKLIGTEDTRSHHYPEALILNNIVVWLKIPASPASSMTYLRDQRRLISILA